MSKIKPYILESRNDEKYLSVNPEYKEFFKRIGVSENAELYFEIDPILSGVPYDDLEDPHFCYLNEVYPKLFCVKSDDELRNLSIAKSKSSIENYLISLEIQIDGLIHHVEQTNHMANEHFPSYVIPNLQQKIKDYISR